MTHSEENLTVHVPRLLSERLAANPHTGPGQVERLDAVVLYADLPGVNHSEETSSSPETTHVTRRITELNTSLSYIIEAVHRYGGSVLTIDETSILATFTHDDAPKQAVSCALTLRSTPNRALRDDLKIGLGKGTLTLAHVGEREPDGWRRAIFLGEASARAVASASLATRGDIVAGPALAEALDASLTGKRLDAGFAYIEDMLPLAAPTLPFPLQVNNHAIRPYVPTPIEDESHEDEDGRSSNATYVTSMVVHFEDLAHNDPLLGEKLQTYLSQAGDIIHEHRGVLVAVYAGMRGSQMQAAFGSRAGADVAERNAVRAAVALTQLRNPGIRYQRIGVASGWAYAGSLGSPARQSYAVIGEPVTLSARLSAVAGPKQIVVDAATHDRAGKYFAFQARTNVKIRGLTQAQSVYIFKAERTLETAVSSLQAGKQAHEQADHTLAIEYFDTALEHLATLPLDEVWQDLTQLRLLRAEVFLSVGNVEALTSEINEVRGLAWHYHGIRYAVQAALLDVERCHLQGNFREMERLAIGAAQLAGEEEAYEELERALQLQAIARQAIDDNPSEKEA